MFLASALPVGDLFQILIGLPATIKIGVVFGGLLVALRLRLSLDLALLAGGVVLDLWASRGPWQTGMDFIGGFMDVELWMLLAMTVLIIEVARFMTTRENSDELLAATSRLGGNHGRIVSLMALPAVIGLVPMPAGACFSAPFVEQMAGAGHDAAWKTVVNYWFRHLWEYWWPLYPGVMLAATLFSLDMTHFTATLFLFTPWAALVGYLLLVRPHRRELTSDGINLPKPTSRQAIVLAPLVTVLATIFLLPLAPGPWKTHHDGAAAKLLPAIIGLGLALVIVFADELRTARRAGAARWRPPQFGASVWSKKSLSVFLSVIGVMIFKHMLECSGLLLETARQLNAAHVPAMLAVMILPFLAGVVTGLSVGFIGTSFPFVVALLHAPDSHLTPLATLLLAYGCGYAGLLLSPVHLCLLLSRDYFQAPFGAVYRLLIPPTLLVILAAVAGYAAFIHLGW